MVALTKYLFCEKCEHELMRVRVAYLVIASMRCCISSFFSNAVMTRVSLSWSSSSTSSLYLCQEHKPSTELQSWESLHNSSQTERKQTSDKTAMHTESCRVSGKSKTLHAYVLECAVYDHYHHQGLSNLP